MNGIHKMIRLEKEHYQKKEYVQIGKSILHH